MKSDYYELSNGKQAIYYIYKYRCGFSYGNAFKYLVRASRKPGNSAESDLNKALTYITSSKEEYSYFYRVIVKLTNRLKFSQKDRLQDSDIHRILMSIISFNSYKEIAEMIVAYMNKHGIFVKDEFKQYAKS